MYFIPFIRYTVCTINTDLSRCHKCATVCGWGDPFVYDIIKYFVTINYKLRAILYNRGRKDNSGTHPTPFQL